MKIRKYIWIDYYFTYWIVCDRNFAKDVEKATDPIMDRARQIKEEVSQATNDLKSNLDKNTEAIRAKTGKTTSNSNRMTRLISTRLINSMFSESNRKYYGSWWQVYAGNCWNFKARTSRRISSFWAARNQITSHPRWNCFIGDTCRSQ